MRKADAKVKDKSEGRDTHRLREARQEPERDEIVAAMHDVLGYFTIL